MKRALITLVVILLLSACTQPTPEPEIVTEVIKETVVVTQSPLPTYTPYPTFTPQEPLPTSTPTEVVHTPLPTSTPTQVVPTATPTWTPVVQPTATPTPTPIPVITHWRGEYYGNRDLSGTPVLVRNDVTVDFNWGSNAPAGVVPADGFSARWTRNVEFEAALYRFHILVDDGVRLWVDGQLLINAWYDSGLHEVTVDYPMLKGIPHGLQVEYYEHSGDAHIRLWWEQIVSPSYPDWKAEYWSNRDLSGAPALVRNEKGIEFYWGGYAPVYGLPADNFSARWTRTVGFDAATYRFHIFVDDGTRLWVDDQLIINAWYDHPPHEVTADHSLTKGAHSLRVEYYEHSGDAQIRLWWEQIVSPSYPDWKAEYWSNRDLSGAPALVRNEKGIEFYWGGYAPVYGLPADNFSARWTRTVGFDAATYRFHIFVDDGTRLWVDDQLIINAWYDHPPHEVTADHSLTKGAHSLRVEYYEHTDDAQIRVWWEKAVSPPYPDWKGEYWSNRDLSGAPALVRNDREIDFYWGASVAAPGLPADNFSARWSRQVTFEVGIYHLYAWADDGIRFYVDGDLILNEWHDSRGDEVYTAELTLTGKHQLVVEYYEHAWDARVRFWWQLIKHGPTR